VDPLGEFLSRAAPQRNFRFLFQVRPLQRGQFLLYIPHLRYPFREVPPEGSINGWAIFERGTRDPSSEAWSPNLKQLLNGPSPRKSHGKVFFAVIVYAGPLSSNDSSLGMRGLLALLSFLRRLFQAALFLLLLAPPRSSPFVFVYFFALSFKASFAR